MFVRMTASYSLTCLSLGIDMDEQKHNSMCENAWRSEIFFVYLWYK